MKRHKWTLEEQANFLKKTGELLLRGYPLSEAIESVTFHLSKGHREELQESLHLLKEGYPFYLILKRLKFEEYLIGYVFFAEQHGGLAVALIEGSKMAQKRSKDLSQLKKVFTYPLFLLFITLLLFVFMQKYLLPHFSSLFSSMEMESNFFITILYLFNYGVPTLLCIFLIILTIFAFYYFLHFKKLSSFQQKHLLMKIPVLSSFLRLFYTYYFSAQLSYLLSGGVSINEALSLFEKNEEQPFYQQIGVEMKKLLKSGEKLENIMKRLPFFQHELAMIMKHGQDNGKLDQELMFFATYCLQILEERIEKFMKQIQPFLYSFIGLLIVSMYMAILLPMFHLLNGM